LWNKYIPKDFKIILINNQGGGIFRVLPGKTDSENFRTYFETVHELSAQALCNLHGFKYYSAQDKDSLANELATFFQQNNGPSLLEIKTPRTENEGVLMNFFKTLKAYY
jgi:2-succinyl-5-enolpyruvyl-6-hydroxy-3-cyclohexene-1-carboxylate synthase